MSGLANSLQNGKQSPSLKTVRKGKGKLHDSQAAASAWHYLRASVVL